MSRHAELRGVRCSVSEASHTRPPGGVAACLFQTLPPAPSRAAGGSGAPGATILAVSTRGHGQTDQVTAARQNYGHRRFQNGMGGESGVRAGQGSMVGVRSGQPYQLARNEGCLARPPRVQGQLDATHSVVTDRQQDSGSLSSERRGDEIRPVISTGERHSSLVSRSENNSDSCIREGDGQHDSRRPITEQGDTVVPQSEDRQQSVRALWSSTDRSVCVSPDISATQVHDTGQSRPSRVRSGRPESEVEPQVCVRLSSPDPGPGSPQQVGGDGDEDDPAGAVLERRALAGHTAGPADGHAAAPGPGHGRPDQRHDGIPGPGPAGPAANSMAAMRQAAGIDLQDDVLAVLEDSWRASTRRQYQSVWKQWCQWCGDQLLDPTSISVGKLLDYLHHIKSLGRAWRTIGVHRSALSSILEPGKESPVGQHRLVCRFVKGVFNQNPPEPRISPTWDLAKVLSVVAKWIPAAEIPLPLLTRKLVFLLAVCTAKRASDIMLFSLDKSLCFMDNETVILQTRFGSKTDRPKHIARPIKLKKCEDERLCPVLFFKEYILRTKALRGDETDLFISPYAPHKAVKLATVRRWITAVLTEAGVSAPAGSTRATAASTAVFTGVSLQQLMDSADWSRRSTLVRHYMRVLPEETLQAVLDKLNSMQDAILHTVK